MNAFLDRLPRAALGAVLVAVLATPWGCGTSNPVAPVVPVPPLAVLQLSPEDTTLTLGQNAAFSVTAIDTGGVPVDASRLTWRSTNTDVFTVGRTGVVVTRGEGTARLTVSGGGKSDTSSVTVLPAEPGWLVQTSHTLNTLNGVFAQPDGRSVWAVGAAGRIIASFDAGANWTGQGSNTGFALNAVWFTSANEGWVVGDQGTILHTTDAGGTWASVFSGVSGNDLKDVWFATPDTGWAVGSGGTVLHTFNHGLTWIKTLPTVTSSTLHGVSFFGTRYGWAVGDLGVILGTVDRGLTWAVVSPSVTTQPLKAVWRRGTLIANAVGWQGVTPRTVDDGAGSPQWTLVSSGASNQLEGVCFPSDPVGFAVGLNGTGLVLRTDDGGVTWNPQTAGTAFQLNDVYFIDDLRGWAVGVNGTVLHTGSGGQ